MPLPDPKSAQDISPDEGKRILLIGPPGSGKTTLLRTAPGKKFYYLFDPNARASLQGAPNTWFEEFSPDRLDINVNPLSKDVQKKRGKDINITKGLEPTAYIKWEYHFEEADDTGFFDPYDVIGMDSFTTFQNAIMDRTLWLNARYGKFPEQDDYAPVMTTVQNVWRTVTVKEKIVVATAHEELIEIERGGGRTLWQPVMIGKLRTRIPLLFTDIFRCEVDQRGGKATFLLHTVGDPRHQYVRTSIRGLPAEIDVTIPEDGWDTPEKYGLGALLAGHFKPVPKKEEKT